MHHFELNREIAWIGSHAHSLNHRVGKQKQLVGDFDILDHTTAAAAERVETRVVQGWVVALPPDANADSEELPPRGLRIATEEATRAEMLVAPIADGKQAAMGANRRVYPSVGEMVANQASKPLRCHRGD